MIGPPKKIHQSQTLQSSNRRWDRILRRRRHCKVLVGSLQGGATPQSRTFLQIHGSNCRLKQSSGKIYKQKTDAGISAVYTRTTAKPPNKIEYIYIYHIYNAENPERRVPHQPHDKYIAVST